MTTLFQKSNLQVAATWAVLCALAFVLHGDVLLGSKTSQSCPFMDGPDQHVRMKVTIEKEPTVAGSSQNHPG